MKLWSFILALAMAQGGLAVTPDNDSCNADNCARAVTGTRTGKMPDVTSRAEDCSSFMLITVTPATSTVTQTSTVTVTTTLALMRRQPAAVEQRQVTVAPSSVPAYAAACSGTARYSSACSCWGVTAMTTTAPTPVTTTTTTVTATATVSACPAGEALCGSSCQDLATSNSNCGACGNVCPAGSTCTNGACSSNTCTGKTCNTFGPCGPGGSCVCASITDGTGFCVNGQTACAGLPSCTTSADCPLGGVCAVNTCCGGGVCITTDECGGATAPVMMMGRDFVNGTIASSGTWVP